MTGSRAPQGARGLKFKKARDTYGETKSRPARGAWVEILRKLNSLLRTLVAPRKGRVG